jgi:hypothetical protein
VHPHPQILRGVHIKERFRIGEDALKSKQNRETLQIRYFASMSALLLPSLIINCKTKATFVTIGPEVFLK